MAVNNENQIKNLLKFSEGMLKGENGAELIKRYENTIMNVTPMDILEYQDIMFENGYPLDALKKNADKLINVFYKNLDKYPWEKPETGTFLHYLMKENEGLRNKLEEIKKIIIKNDINGCRKELIDGLSELKEIDYHYIKKENILFPFLEKKMKRYHALSVMWSLHDDARGSLKELIIMLQDNNSSEKVIKILIGKIFFLLYGIAQKEELILYPGTSNLISDEEWEEMLSQSFEYPFSFMETPDKPSKLKDKPNEMKNFVKYDEGNLKLKTETGELTLEQILMIFSKLPLDLTYVNENNKLCFFSKPENRIFPRSPAAIGRDVKNCHPPKSVHEVEKIIESFRSGDKDSATFWINIKGKTILIQYFALRNDKKEYKGVLEVSQDITEIKSIQGEKRLLDME